jgi:hypothetical protein
VMDDALSFHDKYMRSQSGLEFGEKLHFIRYSRSRDDLCKYLKILCLLPRGLS